MPGLERHLRARRPEIAGSTPSDDDNIPRCYELSTGQIFGMGRDKCLETLTTVTQTKSVWMHLG